MSNILFTFDAFVCFNEMIDCIAFYIVLNDHIV